MGTTVFIAGSMNIKNLDAKFKGRIDNVVSQGFEVVVGDADGADSSIQSHLFHLSGAKITVFCSGSSPRNNIGDWPIRSVVTRHAEGTRLFFTAKDIEMDESADFGLMIWDAKSTGTLSNVLELLARKKKSVVFVNKAKLFKNVGDVHQLEELVSYMSDGARRKAEDKIKLTERIELLKHEQAQLFA